MFVKAALLAGLIGVVCVSPSFEQVTTEPENDIRAHNAMLVREGRDLTLQCETTNTQTIHWYRDGVEIKHGGRYVTDQRNNTLTVKGAKYEDVGEYVCGYSMQNGQNFSQIVSIDAKPRVKDFDRSKNLVEGDPLVIRCVVFGYPRPLITWNKDDEPVDFTDPRISTDAHEGLANATLKITELNFDDRADYSCVATSGNNTHNSTIIVRVKDKYAALWPFLGICAEVAILCLIIFIYERRRSKRLEEEEEKEEAGHLTNSHDHKDKDEIRQRK